MNLISAIVKGSLASVILVGMASLLTATPVASARHFQAKADAQPASSTPAAAPTAVNAPAGDKPAFTQEELEQMLAPIALYPDSLLSQVFMASTYPIEVVEADRWIKSNSSLKGDALAQALEKQTWDPSVRSLVNFPQVLAMMSENLSTTVKIGDAFIGQQKQVMETVQKLRAKAQSTGNLKSTPEQNVKVEQAPAGSSSTQVIVIESAKPDVIYVPTYSPTVVYGAWPYPAYPPYPYYPPGYVASNVVSFGLGVACGVAWGYAWGNCNWGRGDVNVNINQNNNYNRNINRNNYQNNFNGNGNGQWKHDPSHRQGASYRNQTTANQVGATGANRQATQARNDYRGKADAGRADINRGGADAFKGNSPSAGNRANTNPGAGAGAGAGNRANNAGTGTGAANRPANNAGSSGMNKSAFSGAGNSGASTRDASNRGASSRSASPSSASRPSSGGGGASRGGGGGGGGGGRGGGGGGGRR